MAKVDRAIIVMALAQNADPNDADTVLGQALSGLHAEAHAILEALEGSGNEELEVLAYSHMYRIEALDNFFRDHMSATRAAQ